MSDLRSLADSQIAAASPYGNWRWERVGGNKYIATRYPSNRDYTEYRWSKFLNSSVPRYLSHGIGILGGISYEAECREAGIEP